ncbi:competence/damage-inducible protein A [Paradesulfitobacterium aromaticivorans]
MKAEIIATGTELLLGQTLNTSAHYLTGKLSSLGIEVDYHITVGDNAERIEVSLRQALGRSELVVTTGGLGPTVDDITKELVAKVLGLEMELDQASLKHVEDFFALRKAAMPESNRKQAYFPKGAKILPNPVGTAPGAIITKDGKTVVILPGPPFEMQPMFENHVQRELERIVGPDAERMNVRVLKIFGMGESAIEEVIADLMNKPNPTMALLAKRAEMHVRLVARSGDAKEARQILDRAEVEIRSRLGDKVFGRDEESMIGLVGKTLRERGLTVATAESCTGGLVGAALTQEPGSSDFYLGGVVSYDNAVKEQMLGVGQQSLEEKGAVSPEVAKEMAAGARARLGTDLALATTGIAGPDGGSDAKPVGLVYIGLATPQGIEAKKFQFYGGRDSVRALTVQAALNWLRLYLLNLKGDFTD